MSESAASTAEGEGGGNGSSALVIAAGLLVAAINGFVAYYGWTSAKDVNEIAEKAKAKLEAMQAIVDRSYGLFTTALERDFNETVIYEPGIELTGKSTDDAVASAKEDLNSLEILDAQIVQEKRLPLKHLISGFVQLREDCKKSIEELNQYPKDTPVKLSLLASAYLRCGNQQKAMELNNRIIHLPITKPSDRLKAKAESNNGNAAIKNGEYAEAIEDYKAAVKTDSTLYGVYYNMAIAFTKNNNSTAAIAALCNYQSFHDGNVLDEIQTDPDNDFKILIDVLGSGWRAKLKDAFDAPCAQLPKG
jgi:tetratricopeptide (TPR) repeat protein